MLILIIAGGAAAIVWLAVFAEWLTPESQVTRAQRSQGVASLLVAIVALGPIVAQCLTPRPARLGFGEITGVPPKIAVFASQATAIGAVALAICLLAANRPHSRGALIVGGSLAGGAFFSSLLGAESGLVRGVFYLPIVFLGLSTVHMARRRILLLARLSTRAYMYASLLAALVAPSWAFRAAPGGIALPGLPGRLFGVGFHPNLLGFTAVVAIIVEVTPTRSRFAMWHCAAAFAVIALAGSRMAWVALIAAALVWVLSNARRRSEGAAGFVAAGGLVSVTIYVLLSVDAATVANLNNRTPIWHQTISLWQRSPLFGIGPSLYRGAAGSQPGVSIAVDQAHNQILQTLAESGVVGLVFLLVALLALFRAALRDWSAGFSTAMAVLAAFACLMSSESPLRVTGASHAMYVDIILLLLVFHRSFASGAAHSAWHLRAPAPSGTAQEALVVQR